MFRIFQVLLIAAFLTVSASAAYADALDLVVTKAKTEATNTVTQTQPVQTFINTSNNVKSTVGSVNNTINTAKNFISNPGQALLGATGLGSLLGGGKGGGGVGLPSFTVSARQEKAAEPDLNPEGQKKSLEIAKASISGGGSEGSTTSAWSQGASSNDPGWTPHEAPQDADVAHEAREYCEFSGDCQ